MSAEKTIPNFFGLVYKILRKIALFKIIKQNLILNVFSKFNYTFTD